MSYILEALKKSDAERKRGEVPTLDSLGTPQLPDEHQNKSRLPWVLTGTLGIAVIALAGIVMLRPFDDTQPYERTAAKIDPYAAAKAPPPVTEPVREPTVKPEPMVTPSPIAQTNPAPAVIASPAPITEPTPASETPVESDTVAVANDELQVEPQAAEVTIYTRTPKAEEPTVEKIEAAPVATEPEPEPKAKPKPTVQTQGQLSAKVHVDRAWGSIDKGMYNQALRNLDRAVAIEPTYAEAWFARGWTNEKSGKELSAIGDYGRAISAKPDHAFALFSRGYLNLYVGSVQSAVTDFVRTQGVAKNQSLRLYSHLWLYLSRSRTNQDAAARLAQDTTGEALDEWPAPLVHHFLGHMEEGRVIAAMDEGPEESRAERRCTGYFFLGISALGKGNKVSARSFFEKALATGAVQFRQYDAAKRELDRLNRS